MWLVGLDRLVMHVECWGSQRGMALRLGRVVCLGVGRRRYANVAAMMVKE